jgi:hypothetical protein
MREKQFATEVRALGNAPRPKSPPAPGAAVSPQHPGMTPDESAPSGYTNYTVPKATGTRRPLTQYGTAQEIMHVFTKVPEDQIQPGDFEQATASFEELRKVDSAQIPPVRPKPPAIATGETPEALPSGNSEF